MKNGFVSIVMVTWNAIQHIERILKSLDEQTYKKIELIIIDNASADGTIEFIKLNCPDLEVIANNSNNGYCEAVNQGIKLCKGRYVMPLNQDMLLAPDFVEEMVRAIELNDEIGMVSGKLYKMKTDGTLTGIIDSAGNVIFRDRTASDRGTGEIDSGQYDKNEYVFGSCGAAPLYKREMLEDIKINGQYYDEFFFSYLEDIDLNWRAQIRGWKCLYAPKAIAYHVRTKSASSKNTKMHCFKNRYLMMLKNDSLKDLIKHIIPIFKYEIKMLARIMRHERFMLKAYFVDVMLLPQMLNMRNKIQKNRIASIENWFADKPKIENDTTQR